MSFRKGQECDQDFTANEHRSQAEPRSLLTTVCTLSCCFFQAALIRRMKHSHEKTERSYKSTLSSPRIRFRTY